MNEKFMRTYNLTRELANTIRETAFRKKVSQSELVRNALRCYLEIVNSDGMGGVVKLNEKEHNASS